MSSLFLSAVPSMSSSSSLSSTSTSTPSETSSSSASIPQSSPQSSLVISTGSSSSSTMSSSTSSQSDSPSVSSIHPTTSETSSTDSTSSATGMSSLSTTPASRPASTTSKATTSDQTTTTTAITTPTSYDTSTFSATTSSTPLSTTSSLFTQSSDSSSTATTTTSIPVVTKTRASAITLRSTVIITTTDSRGSPTTSTPSAITSLLTSTQSDGAVVTITQIEVNPTLSPNNNRNSTNSAFFSNTGAVAGTFILVGLAAASILLWIFFAVRRRRRTRKLEHDSAVSATLAAAGFNRTPLDVDDAGDQPEGSTFASPPDLEMSQRANSSLGMAAMQSHPSNRRTSGYYDATEPEVGDPFNPYAEFGVPPSRKDGYVPARSSSPPFPDAHSGHYHDRNGSASTGGRLFSHSTSGSYEPLLASFYRQSTGSPPSPTVPLAPLPRSNTEQNTAGAGPSKPRESARSSVYDSEDTDERLDPNIRQRLGESGDNSSARELRDEEDYSRPVLAVRNLPDTSSRES
ncbi:hypothetical protein AX17_000521 [Amanita inopinata Kibby_2008]|nr:hypothetical protein AX17_000521 [Amanita inopinata Kibby_2008]